jgi:hypothetical protein
LIAASKGAERADMAPECTMTGASSTPIKKVQSFECSMLRCVSVRAIATGLGTHLVVNGILRRFGHLAADGRSGEDLVTPDFLAIDGRGERTPSEGLGKLAEQWASVRVKALVLDSYLSLQTSISMLRNAIKH